MPASPETKKRAVRLFWGVVKFFRFVFLGTFLVILIMSGKAEEAWSNVKTFLTDEVFTEEAIQLGVDVAIIVKTETKEIKDEVSRVAKQIKEEQVGKSETRELTENEKLLRTLPQGWKILHDLEGHYRWCNDRGYCTDSEYDSFKEAVEAGLRLYEYDEERKKKKERVWQEVSK